MKIKMAIGDSKTEDMVIDDCWNKIGVQGNGDRSCAELDKVVHCRNCKKFVVAGRRLLDRESTVDYKRDWYEQISSAASDHKKTEAIVTFRLGDQWFGLPPRYFDEVIKCKGIHSIPHNRSDKLKGVVAIRGELQLCVSIGHILGVNRGGSQGINVKDGVYERMIVLSGEDVKYVFPVSEIREIYHYSPIELGDPPATSSVNSQNAVLGVINWNDKYVSCLDFNILTELIGGIFE